MAALKKWKWFSVEMLISSVFENSSSVAKNQFCSIIILLLNKEQCPSMAPCTHTAPANQQVRAIASEASVEWSKGDMLRSAGQERYVRRWTVASVEQEGSGYYTMKLYAVANKVRAQRATASIIITRLAMSSSHSSVVNRGESQG